MVDLVDANSINPYRPRSFFIPELTEGVGQIGRYFKVLAVAEVDRRGPGSPNIAPYIRQSVEPAVRGLR